ncbi:MAG: helix-hairpin-helix domain-containing protein [Candidatus Kariarchaeaceae archaeon]|jgi:ribosomal protein L35AE/L33A/predicted flap endonuclease-1-like 5' DNA nuclease
MELTKVNGIGPATAIKLQAGGIKTAEDLAGKEPEQLVILGVGKATATKIIKNAIDAVGTVEKQPKKEKKAKKPEKKVKKPKPKEVDDTGFLVGQVSGVGPKTEKILIEAGYTSAQSLAKAVPDDLIGLGIGKTTAGKIIKNASESIGEVPEVAPEKVEKPKAKTKPKKKAKLEKEVPTAEDQRSPMPQGIPTKKKRGVQIRGISEEEAEQAEKIAKPEGWGVKAKKLSKSEIEARKKRQEEIARSRKITRPIPTSLRPVKAVKDKETTEKGEKPVKLEKKEKKVSKQVKKKAKAIDYYSQRDIHMVKTGARKRGISAKSSTKQPRIELDRDTYLGKISSHRRSRRVVHNRQVIVDLDEGFNPEQLVGQKVYFTYPDNEMRVPGSVARRFGKSTSGKVLVFFKKGIRMEGIHQKLFIK